MPQPPSGGCVLKHNGKSKAGIKSGPAAFGRLCVETLGAGYLMVEMTQPPSGGCVLKQRQAPYAQAN